MKRFDRKDNKKVHMTSLSALLETTHRIPNLDYSHLFQVIENIKGYRLSPAYDITSTPNKFAHEMTVNGNGLSKEKDLLDIVYKFKLSLSACKSIISKIKSVIGID